MNNIVSWSNTRLQDFEKCPAYFKFKYIDKVKEKFSPQLLRGRKIHNNIEKWIKGEESEFTPPKELKILFDDVKELERKETELKLGFDRDWNPISPTDWINCWYRANIDYIGFLENTVIIIDWKTGKFRDVDLTKYTEQLEQYALSIFLKYPDVVMCCTSLVFVDVPCEYPDMDYITFKRKDIETMKIKWEERSKPMFEEITFPPKKNWTCKWCNFNKINGGKCAV